jgi:hypothetical protein
MPQTDPGSERASLSTPTVTPGEGKAADERGDPLAPEPGRDCTRRNDGERSASGASRIGRAAAWELADSKPVTSRRFGVVLPR